jgi:site-specific DNA-methyltransferase (adenine-specific)
MSKTGNNAEGAGKKLTVDSLQLTVQDKKEGKGLNTESTERRGTPTGQAQEEVKEFKVEESKKEKPTDRELTRRAQRTEHGGHGEGMRPEGSSALPQPAFEDSKHHIKIYQGDCLEILAQIPEGTVDLVFADPPYFLSNGGITCHAGRMVSVNKGEWDKSRGPDANHEFNRAWLAACQRVLKPNGTIWVSGTAHVIHSVGFAMQQLGFKLLNDISWVKPNPPPNLSCRYFTHATETIIWAAKNSKSRHTFHYKLMKDINRGKQMESVWEPMLPGCP